MNIEEYISSGILELYVMDQLSASERAQVEKTARDYPEIKQEIQRIEESLEQYANVHAVTPLSSLKDRVFDKIEKEEVRTIKKTERSLSYIAAAASVVALISSGAALYFNLMYQEARDKVLVLEQQSNAMAEMNRVKLERFEASQSEDQKIIRLLQDTSTTLVPMKGTENHTAAYAAVYWNKYSGEVYIGNHQLPDAPAGKEYQLWAIVEGQPKDAGMLCDSKGMLFCQMKNINQAQAFAVTLENKGGSATPTLETMVVLGEIKL